MAKDDGRDKFITMHHPAAQLESSSVKLSAYKAKGGFGDKGWKLGPLPEKKKEST